MNIVITIPAKVDWDDYQKELNVATNGGSLNFKVTYFPKKTVVGEKCFICYKGRIIGYHTISSFDKKSFFCTITGKEWVGRFIVRSGRFMKIKPIKMRGFQGFRYINNP